MQNVVIRIFVLDSYFVAKAMDKSTTSKFLGGAAVGLALGVAASMFLSSKKGKEMTENVTDTVADFYKSIAPKIKKIKSMGEKEYKAFMEDAADKYSKAKKLSKERGDELMEQVQNSWEHFSKNLE